MSKLFNKYSSWLQGFRVPHTPLVNPFFDPQGDFDNKRCLRNRLILTESGRERRDGITAEPAAGENGLKRPNAPLEMAEKEIGGLLKSPKEGSTMRRSLAGLLLQVSSLCLVIQGMANAQDDFDRKRGGPAAPTVLELKMLPPFCSARFEWSSRQADTEEVKMWKNILGGTFYHVHHYCMALNYLNRIDRGIGSREDLLGLAGGDFQYMQNNIAENDILRPQVEFNIGLVLYKQDRIIQAIGQLRKAIQMRPNYERAYLLLGFCYRRLGDHASASDALQKGLIRVPESRALREALNEMNITKKEPDGVEIR
jgi:hypothetical protein